MRILLIATETAPLIPVGGLAQYMQGLSAALYPGQDMYCKGLILKLVTSDRKTGKKPGGSYAH